MSFVIVQRSQQGKKETVTWLVTVVPQRWAEREQAMRFDTRKEARRAAVSIKLSGDSSIGMALPPSTNMAP
jgi:hypothetical protein